MQCTVAISCSGLSHVFFVLHGKEMRKKSLSGQSWDADSLISTCLYISLLDM